MWKYIGVILVLCVIGAFGDDKSVTVGNITTKVRGQSGKILVYTGDNETNGVIITYDAIKEVETDGQDTINSHSFNTFASQSFTFSSLENTTYPDSNVTVTQFSFLSDISVGGGTAKLTSFVYMFTEDGNITVDGADFEVKEGMMKFNVFVENWPFCDQCTNKGQTVDGGFLDVYIEIKGQGTPEAAGGDSADGTYSLGDGATVVVPKQVFYDGSDTPQDMPTGYPKLITQGSKQIFVFRFVKFTTSALYDPTVALGDENTDPTPTEEEKNIGFGDISCKVKGRSGKIELKRTGQTGDATQHSITVEFDNLKEKKSDGADIRDNNHNFNTFASQDFTFSAPSDVQYPGKDSSEILATKLTFMATLDNSATLDVDLYIFKEDGELETDGETHEVKAGNVKFNVKIMNWAFCDGTAMCQQSETGEYLDFEVVMKGSAGTASKKEGQEYDLGSGEVWLSTKVTVDGTATDMASGYPMLGMQGSKQVFKFRFQKFTTSVVYDPVIELADSGSASATASVGSILFIALCALLRNMV